MPWINHLPPVCWSTFGILVWNDSGYVNLTQWWYFFIIFEHILHISTPTLWYFVFLYLIFLSQQVLYFLLSTLVLTLYIDVVLSLSMGNPQGLEKRFDSDSHIYFSATLEHCLMPISKNNTYIYVYLPDMFCLFFYLSITRSEIPWHNPCPWISIIQLYGNFWGWMDHTHDSKTAIFD